MSPKISESTVNATGKEKRDPPEYYEKVHAILGQKDRVTLEKNNDSLSLTEEGVIRTKNDPSTTSVDFEY